VTGVEESVAVVFRQLRAEEFEGSTDGPDSGWQMSLPSGQDVSRSNLQAVARPLIDLGPDAVPPLLAWVESEEVALRYVAIYALQQITGEQPYLLYFKQGDIEGNQVRAIDVWQKWYEAHAG
jgi:hypothetical protein